MITDRLFHSPVWTEYVYSGNAIHDENTLTYFIQYQILVLLSEYLPSESLPEKCITVYSATGCQNFSFFIYITVIYSFL